MPASRERSTLIALCALASLSCGSDAGKLPVSAGLECFVSSVTVVPATASVAVGASATFTASVAASNCSQAPAVGWQTSDPTIASVTQAGVVTGVGAGTATITATAATRTGTAVVTVTAPAVASVSVTASSASVLTGATLQATAQTRDGSGNVLTGRTVTWQSSNAAIATVSNAGLITGVLSGSVTITATSEGRSGQLVITVLGRGSLTIASVAPAANATNVGIETPIRIQFSEAITAATVSSTTLRVSSGVTTIAGAYAVNGNVVTFTPSAPLTEFNTSYTIAVSASVLSTAGNFLASPSTTTFTTAFWDPAYYYRITNQSLGATQSLDTFSGSFQCFMGVTGNASGQFWYFTPVAGSPGVAMKNSFQGDTRMLEGADGLIPCLLNPPPAAGGAIATGQIWVPVAFPQFPNTYRLQNANHGATRSLDVTGTTTPAGARMLATANIAAQAWIFTRFAKR